MDKQQLFNQKIDVLARGSNGEMLLEVLDETMNHIADARNGDWDTTTRKACIAVMQEVLYNKVKSSRNRKNNPITGNDDGI